MSLFARIYDLAMAPVEHGRVGELRREIVSRARGRVLEIGAGTGLNFPYYKPTSWVVAIDPDTGMLERARTRAGAARAEILLVVADAQALPFHRGVFDESVVVLAMCTIPNPVKALAELRRVLAPGGALRMLEHVRVDHPAIVGLLQDWLTPFWRRIAKGCRLNRRTAHVVTEAGFQLDASTSHFGGYLRTILARTLIQAGH